MSQDYQAPIPLDSKLTASFTRLNASLEALLTCHSGATEPAETVPFMLWADTGNGLLKVRNADDDGWVVIADMSDDIALYLPLSGGTMSGDIAMGSNKVTGLASGTNSGDAVNKSQLDGKLSLSGGTMTGNIDMDGQNVVSVAQITNPASTLTVSCNVLSLDGHLSVGSGKTVDIPGNLNAATISSYSSTDINVAHDLDMQSSAKVINLPAPTAAGDAARLGTVRGNLHALGPWMLFDTTLPSAGALKLADTDANNGLVDIVLPKSGVVVAMSAMVGGTVTSGSFALFFRQNNTTDRFSPWINGISSTGAKYSTGGTTTFSAGDYLRLSYTNNASFSGTVDIIGYLWVYFNE